MSNSIFTISGDNLTLGTGSGLVAFRTAATDVTAGGRIAIRRIEVTQSGTATAAMCRLLLSTRDTAGTYTMTSVTPRNITLGGPASSLSGNTAPVGAAARVGINSSADSGGTYTDHYAAAFCNLNGWLWVPTPEERIIVPSATVWVCRFATAPGTTTGWSVSITIEELVK